MDSHKCSKLWLLFSQAMVILWFEVDASKLTIKTLLSLSNIENWTFWLQSECFSFPFVEQEANILPKKSSILLCLIVSFTSLHQRTPTGRTVTGRTVAELEVHTKKFYSPVEWKEISSGLWTSQKALSSVSSTSPTLERPYMDTYMKDSPSVRKHGNFWPCDMRSKRLKANIWGGPSTRCCPAGALRYKTCKSKEQLLHCKRVKISTINELERSFSSLWSLREGKDTALEGTLS